MCARDPNGTARCLGFNFAGQLGNSSNTDSALAVAVANLTGVTSIDAGHYASCAVASGAVRCWGTNADGQLGDGTLAARNTPSPGVLANATQVAVGQGSTCARRSDGLISCWGKGTVGQLGDGSATSSTIPVDVVSSGFGSAQLVSVGDQHACAAATSGAVWCWGNNSGGQLGNGGYVNSAVPVQVLDVGNATMTTSGSSHSCALIGDGGVWCWGSNDVGQLGDGTLSSSPRPVRVLDLEPAVAIAAGSFVTCAATATGALRCWGENDNGQLGDGNPPANATPRQSIIYCP
jgi:alpha-tubulin suppressor-like RCC1 family protein